MSDKDTDRHAQRQEGLKGTEPKRKSEGYTMASPTTVQKWGNSLAVRIPKDVAEKVHIDQGSEMEWQINEKEEITLVKKQRPKVYSLEELLAQCTPDKQHDFIDFGIEGNELI